MWLLSRSSSRREPGDERSDRSLSVRTTVRPAGRLHFQATGTKRAGGLLARGDEPQEDRQPERGELEREGSAVSALAEVSRQGAGSSRRRRQATGWPPSSSRGPMICLTISRGGRAESSRQIVVW